MCACVCVRAHLCFRQANARHCRVTCETLKLIQTITLLNNSKGEAPAADPLSSLFSRVRGRRQFSVTCRYVVRCYTCVCLCVLLWGMCVWVYIQCPCGLIPPPCHQDGLWTWARMLGICCWWKRVGVVDGILTTGKQGNSQRMWRC